MRIKVHRGLTHILIDSRVQSFLCVKQSFLSVWPYCPTPHPNCFLTLSPEDESSGLHGFLNVIVHSASGLKQSLSESLMQTTPHLPDFWSLQLLVLSIYWVTTHLERTEHDSMLFIDIAEMRLDHLVCSCNTVTKRALLSSPSDLYCTLEVDSFGFFSNKAKTRVYRYTTEPKWNEVRDNMRETSSQHLHSQISCCKKSEMEIHNSPPFSVSKRYHC